MTRDHSISPVRRCPPIGGFQIFTSTDAFDAVDLARPSEFRRGVIVLLLDDDDRPFLALAIDRAPSNQLVHIAEFLIDARFQLESPRFSGVVFGVIGDDSTEVSGSEVADWHEAQHLLAAHGVALVDLVVVRPTHWSSFSERGEVS
jgi:hypothetical protein